MIKIALYTKSSQGPAAIPLFNNQTDSYFEKVAAPSLMPDVVKYIESLRPRADAQYVLLNAMGDGEHWSSNVNGDYFPEAALIHKPDNWTGNPLLDKIHARDWPYGFPTFYNAKPFMHHRNKDFAPHNHPVFGEVELALWNPRMHRVELVNRVDKDLCIRGGGTSLWDRLHSGECPDVSMGCKVPFDTCSICLDKAAYQKALATFDPKKHKYPGAAVLEVHKALIKATTHGDVPGHGIRGVSITRKDYCEHALKLMNRILPDGRKVYVINDWPNFFDISFVFIGADKTAKVMMKIAEDELTAVAKGFYGAPTGLAIDPSASPELSMTMGDPSTKPECDEDMKVASTQKRGEISKNVPSQFAPKAVSILTSREPSISKDVLDMMATRPLEEGLTTATGLGIVLRPHEFQRMTLRGMGEHSLAKQLEESGLVFPKTKETTPVSLGLSLFNDVLAKLLLPLLSDRSAFGPSIERRAILMIQEEHPKESRTPSSLSMPLLHKISAAYNGYRHEIMNFIPQAQSALSNSSLDEKSLAKLAQVSGDELFTSLSAHYLRDAFFDEVGTTDNCKQANAGVEKGFPSRNTRDIAPLNGGFLTCLE